MNQTLYLFTAAAGLAGLLTTIAVWSPRKLWIKVAAVMISTLFLPSVYLSMSNLLSRPKPVALEWSDRDLSDAVVLSAKLLEDRAIYVWLQVRDIDEPRSYVLPWNQERARQLHGARREAKSKGTKVKMRRPFLARAENTEAVFYASPPPSLPPKNGN